MADSESDIADLRERVTALQRAIYYLVWKRTGFGDQCIHCGTSYPKHSQHCRAAEIEQLIR